MSARATLATTRRVLEQLRRDHRTLALVLVVPPALLVLLRYVLDGIARRVPASRGAARRPLSVDRDVPRHVDRDAA